VSAENPLHRARVERGIALAEVARKTCLSPQVVQKIDAGRFDELPAGVYARSYVRAFATAVDLPPEPTLAAIADRLPTTEDPLPGLRDVAERSSAAWMNPLASVAQAAAVRLAPVTSGLSRLCTGHKPLGRIDWLPDQWSRLTPLRPPGRRVAAIGADAAVLILLHTLLVQLTAWTTGVSTENVLAAAGPAVTAVWALLVAQYFVLLAGIGGRTPGAWVFNVRATRDRPRTEPLGLRAILHRTVLY
jgi:hypothetical protein